MSTTLLPTGDGLHVEHITTNAHTLFIQVRTVAASALCPLCRQASQRVHSRYRRTLADLPWNRVAVRIQLRSRKFFCDNGDCERLIFTEPLPQLAERYARKTLRMQEALYLIGYALGGEAGARVAIGLGLKVSPDALLERVRQVRSSLVTPHTSVRVLGVDEWAYRRGQRYGTILVDLERRRLVDLLPDRSKESLAAWLKAHPGVEILCRDRAGCYAEGAAQGAPDAIQVADRWHLLRSVAEALEEVLSQSAKVIRQAAHAVQPVPDGQYAPTLNERIKQAARQRRLERFTRFRRLLTEHPEMCRKELAKAAGISRATLYRWLPQETFPERKGMPVQERLIDPFVAYLKQRFEAGCHNERQLLQEIREQGFTGTAVMLRHRLKEWRVPLRARKARERRWVPSPRATKWLLLRPPEKRRAQEQAFVDALLQRAPHVQQAQELVLAFFALLRKEGKQTLDEWLQAAQESGLSPLQQRVNGINKDKAAVLAAVKQPYSNGQTEGQVHRLKLIKRSMYGRAKFDLLRARVLPMQQAS